MLPPKKTAGGTPTPSPREFGLCLMKLAKRVRPNSQGVGAFWLVFLFAKNLN